VLCRWSVRFNGLDNALLLPPTADVQCVSAWVMLQPAALQPSLNPFLLDARDDLAGSNSAELYLSRASVGIGWASLHVDAVALPMDWSSLPVGGWAHVHLQAHWAFHTAITLFARKAGAGTGLAGALASVYLWGRVLLPTELQLVALAVTPVPFGQAVAFANTTRLLRYYNVEEGHGAILIDALAPLPPTRSQRAAQLYPGTVTAGPLWVRENPLVPGWHPLRCAPTITPPRKSTSRVWRM
jgi:hypothetical protein